MENVKFKKVEAFVNQRLAGETKKMKLTSGGVVLSVDYRLLQQYAIEEFPGMCDEKLWHKSMSVVLSRFPNARKFSRRVVLFIFCVWWLQMMRVANKKD